MVGRGCGAADACSVRFLGSISGLVLGGLSLGVGHMALAQTYEGPYFGTVTQIVDGDTFEADIQIWPTISATVSVRFRGIDAPELSRAACVQERLGAAEARDALTVELPVGAPVRLERVEEGSFAGRVIADVYRPNQERKSNVGNILLRHNFFEVWYPSDPAIDWCRESSG